ncbi:hypothetical protein ATCC90586_003252 [Pythium insidiosum]|nr:hypothetical protein ATCC90586_003252 [Pythium insidiosum]
MLDVVADLSWQWRPDAAVTAVDSTQRCTALALQYADCVVIRVRPSAWPPLRHQEPEEPADSKDIELHGHVARVTSLRFYACVDSTDVLLASASSDRVLVWHLDGDFQVQRSVVVEKPSSEPSCVAFDQTGTLLALGCDRDVEIRIIQSAEVLLTLEGHVAKVTRCEFHPLRQHLLLTCSEDRTFKIWDLASKALLFQSAVLSAFPILSLACNPVTGDACFGFADGSLRVFSIHEAFAREHAVLDLESFLRRHRRKQQERDDQALMARQSTNVISALPSWARSDSGGMQSIGRRSVDLTSDRRRSLLSPGEDHVAEVATPVLGLRYLCVDVVGREHDLGHAPDSFNTHGIGELLDREQYLVAATPSHLLAINALSLEIVVLQDLQVALSKAGGGDPLDAVTVAREVCFHGAEGSDMLFCGLVSAFLPCFTLECVSVRQGRSVATGSSSSSSSDIGNQAIDQRSSHPDSQQQLELPSGERVSVIATGPPPPDSVLNLPPLSSASKRTPPKKSGKKPAVTDKPITFCTRIRSSGYGAAAPFGVKRPASADKKRSTSAASVESFLKEYPRDCGMLQHYQAKHALPPKTLHQGAIHHIEFSPDAKWLASAGSDKLALVSRLPFSRYRGEGNVMAGHDHAVRAARWSHSNRLLLTTSSDKTARLWVADSDAPLLTFHGAAPPKAPSSLAQSSARRAIRGDVVDATFFYMDRFILSATGNAVRLYQFEVDEVFARAQTKKLKRNDLLHDENQSRKKKVAEWRWADMQGVTALTCVNGSFLSSIVLAAGSDRSLRVLDAAAGRSVRVIRDAHARAAHSVALPRASCFVSHPANFYDLLLSSAPNNTIHLWDIRADNCVMRFGEHVNRVHQLGVAFSPCMRFVATGSEDRQTYVYDVRTGRCLTRLQGHTDVVTSVAFNPLHPQLATASYDGTVRFYSDRHA